MERLYQQNQRIVQRSEQLVTALRNFAFELGPHQRKELEDLIIVSSTTKDPMDID